MAELIGRPIATAEQTRAMLKIGVTYKTTEETLANLGLPPNRADGNAGFHVHVTDGKLPKATDRRLGRAHGRRVSRVRSSPPKTVTGDIRWQ